MSQSGSISGTEDSRSFGIGLVRGREHLGFRALFDHAAALHHHHVIGDGAHRGEVMGYEHVGQRKFLLEPVEQFQDALLHDLVEGRCDLVADDELGLGGQRAGDADALFLPPPDNSPGRRSI